MKKNNAVVNIYTYKDSRINEIAHELFETIQFRDDFGLNGFDGHSEYFPYLVINSSGYRECFSKEIPRDKKIIDFYIPEYKGLHIIGHFYFSYLDKKFPMVYLEMFFSNNDYNLSKYEKMCFAIDFSTKDDYSNL